MESVDTLLVEAEEDKLRCTHELLSMSSMRRRYRKMIEELMAKHSIPRTPLPESHEVLACMYDELVDVFERGTPALQRAWLNNNAQYWLKVD